VEEVIEEVEEDVELSVSHYLLLMSLIFSGVVLIGLSIQGVMHGFGPLDVDPRRVIDHPCRFTDEVIKAKADAALAMRQANGSNSGAESPNTAASPATSPRGTPREGKKASDMRTAARTEAFTKNGSGEAKGVGVLTVEGEDLKAPQTKTKPEKKAETTPRAVDTKVAVAAVAAVAEVAAPLEARGGVLAEFTSKSVQEEVGQRVKWLVVLMLLQSIASLILHEYRHLLEAHLVIALYLMMVVGAGGNAGAQSVARSIQDLTRDPASGTPAGLARALTRQAMVGAYLAPALGLVTYAIVYALHGHENPLGLGLSCTAIVFLSVVMGAAAPYLMIKVDMDIYHSAAAIQVAADVVGVACVCVICTLVFTDNGIFQ